MIDIKTSKVAREQMQQLSVMRKALEELAQEPSDDELLHEAAKAWLDNPDAIADEMVPIIADMTVTPPMTHEQRIRRWFLRGYIAGATRAGIRRVLVEEPREGD